MVEYIFEVFGVIIYDLFLIIIKNDFVFNGEWIY